LSIFPTTAEHLVWWWVYMCARSSDT